jgi:LacI family transcriptional regulator
VATVSYVLNNGPRPVRPETRRQVLAAMERLGYHPNAMARALVRGRVNTFGVVFGKVEPAIVTNAYVTQLLQGVMTAAADLGYNVTLFTQSWRGRASSANGYKDGRTDGVLVIAPLTDTDMVSALAAKHLPMVVISATLPAGTGIPYVDVDNYLGARLATEHLLSLGHTRIAHILGEPVQPSVPDRRRGFCDAMTAAGLEVPAGWLISSRYDQGEGHRAATALLTRADRPTALFAGNDGIALGALEAARDLGISVPGQLSVVGFDDIPAAALVTPQLTTVRQPLTEIGEKATRMLVSLIEGKPQEQTGHREAPELVVRGSSAPPGLP